MTKLKLFKCSAARDSSGLSSSIPPNPPSSNFPPPPNVPTTIGFCTIDPQIQRGAEITLDTKVLDHSQFESERMAQSSQEDLGFWDKKQRPLEKKLQMLVSQELGTPESPMTDSGPFSDTGISSLENTGGAGGDSKLKAKKLNLDLQDPTTDTDMDYSELSPSSVGGQEELPPLSPIQSEHSISEITSTTVVTTKTESVNTEAEKPVEKTDAVLSPILFHDNKATSPMSLKGQIQDLKETKDASSSPPQFATQSASTSPPKKGDLEPRRTSTTATTPNDGPTQSLPDDSLEFHMELKSESEEMPLTAEKVEKAVEQVKASMPVESKNGRLKLSLVKGKDLQKKDKFSKSDPYATIQVDDNNYKTKTIKNNHNPEWNHEVDIKVDSNEDSIVHIEVFNKKTFGKDDSLGQAEVTVKQLIQSREMWVELTNCKSGQVLVSSNFIAEVVEEEIKPENAKNTDPENIPVNKLELIPQEEVNEAQDTKEELVSAILHSNTVDLPSDVIDQTFKGETDKKTVEKKGKLDESMSKEKDDVEIDNKIAKEDTIAKSEEASGLEKDLQAAKASLKEDTKSSFEVSSIVIEKKEDIFVQSSSRDETKVNIQVMGGFKLDNLTFKEEELIKDESKVLEEATSPSEQLLDKAIGEFFDSNNKVVSFEVETELCNVENKGKVTEMTQKIESQSSTEKEDHKILVKVGGNKVIEENERKSGKEMGIVEELGDFVEVSKVYSMVKEETSYEQTASASIVETSIETSVKESLFGTVEVTHAKTDSKSEVIINKDASIEITGEVSDMSEMEKSINKDGTNALEVTDLKAVAKSEEIITKDTSIEIIGEVPEQEEKINKDTINVVEAINFETDSKSEEIITKDTVISDIPEKEERINKDGINVVELTDVKTDNISKDIISKDTSIEIIGEVLDTPEKEERMNKDDIKIVDVTDVKTDSKSEEFISKDTLIEINTVKVTDLETDTKSEEFITKDTSIEIIPEKEERINKDGTNVVVVTDVEIDSKSEKIINKDTSIEIIHQKEERIKKDATNLVEVIDVETDSKSEEIIKKDTSIEITGEVSDIHEKEERINKDGTNIVEVTDSRSEIINKDTSIEIDRDIIDIPEKEESINKDGINANKKDGEEITKLKSTVIDQIVDPVVPIINEVSIATKGKNDILFKIQKYKIGFQT